MVIGKTSCDVLVEIHICPGYLLPAGPFQSIVNLVSGVDGTVDEDLFVQRTRVCNDTGNPFPNVSQVGICRKNISISSDLVKHCR